MESRDKEEGELWDWEESKVVGDAAVARQKAQKAQKGMGFRLSPAAKNFVSSRSKWLRASRG
ncbi:hypothetical protein CTA1_13285 [Colletotrichum tanaceti]|uniref:Uncharacterized protein n=1 Tax=Colletotrichum tanaceti TaxID=1306861 RepID=A0A4U6X4X8_9PEZI|nr:hypothetical protein CTA1_13285 [Colletotrichum tanaceti]